MSTSAAMKLINESIRVEVRNGIPSRLRWRERTYRTRKVLDFWIHQTRWWGREEKRVYFRLETDRGIIEVYRASESPRNHPPKTQDGSHTAHPSKTAHPSNTNAPGSGQTRPGPSSFFPIEGDTHTREYRRTDAAYRPDRTDAHRPDHTDAHRPDHTDAHRPDHMDAHHSDRSGGPLTADRARPADRARMRRTRWMLSRIVD